MERWDLKEAISHGTVLFPLAVYEWKEDMGDSVNLHWHEETEILYFEQGIFHMRVNMGTFEIQAPALVFIPAGDIHSIQFIPGQKEKAIVFDLNMLSFEFFDGIQFEIIKPLVDKRLQLPFVLTEKDTTCFQVILELFEKVFAQAKTDSLSGYMRSKSFLYEMLAVLYEENLFDKKNLTEASTVQKMEHIKVILTYVKEQYDNPISIEEIAQRVGLNAQYVCRYFKRITGMTLTEYINEVRIEKAAQMLRETDEKIITVATACGYDNISYFIKRFKQQKGNTPQAFRNKMSK